MAEAERGGAPLGDDVSKTNEVCHGEATDACDSCHGAEPVTEACDSCHGEAWGDYRDLLPRLKRIEGQVRGIQRMVEEQRYCVDILTQISAAQAALRQVSLAILASHTKGCVTRAIREDGGQNAVDELLAVVNKLCTP